MVSKKDSDKISDKSIVADKPAKDKPVTDKPVTDKLDNVGDTVADNDKSDSISTSLVGTGEGVTGEVKDGLVTPLKKMTTKTIVGNPKKFLKYLDDGADGDSKLMYTIVGRVTQFILGSGDYGEWFKFKGIFHAQRHDEVKFSSVECFIPEPVATMLSNSLKGTINRETGEIDPITVPIFIDMGIHVYMKRRDDLARGYEYVVKLAVDTAQVDPLAHLTVAFTDKKLLTKD